MLKQFSVGNLFQKGVTKYPEGARFNLDRSGATLTITMDHPSSQETQDIKKGTFCAEVVEIDDVIYFLCRFGTNVPWMDCPFTPHLMADKECNLEDIYETSISEIGLTVFLIDASTGILKAGRRMGLTHELSVTFKEMLDYLKAKPFSVEEYDRSITRTYSAYSTEQLLQLARSN